jgi:hypothetical protein
MHAKRSGELQHRFFNRSKAMALVIQKIFSVIEKFFFDDETPLPVFSAGYLSEFLNDFRCKMGWILR